MRIFHTRSFLNLCDPRPCAYLSTTVLPCNSFRHAKDSRFQRSNIWTTGNLYYIWHSFSKKGEWKGIKLFMSWKSLEGISPNCGLEVITSKRRGRGVKIPPSKEQQGKSKIYRRTASKFRVQDYLTASQNLSEESWKFLLMISNNILASSYKNSLMNRRLTMISPVLAT